MRIVSLRKQPSFFAPDLAGSEEGRLFSQARESYVVTFIENIMSHYLLRSIALIWQGVGGRKRRGRMEGNILWGTPAINNNYSMTPSWI